MTILGWSGFIGSWITATLMTAMEIGLDVRLKLYSRNGALSLRDLKDGVRRKVEVERVDFSEVIPRDAIDSDFLLIASTPTSKKHGIANHDSVNQSTEILSRFLIENYSNMNCKPTNIVHLSSGAIYQCYRSSSVPYSENEDIQTDSRSSYIMSKIKFEETLRSIALTNPNLKISNPRLFSFYGPGLPLNEHFAIGNFILDASLGRPLRILGNPETTRSYLHISDLTVTLIKLLINPFPGAINLGSENQISMIDLAGLICRKFSCKSIVMKENSDDYSYYVPRTSRAQELFGEIETVDFLKGLKDWMTWIERYS